MQAFGIFLVFLFSFFFFFFPTYSHSYHPFSFEHALCGVSDYMFVSLAGFFLLLIRNAGAHDTIECRYEGDEALGPCILDSFSPLLLLGLNEVCISHSCL